MIPAFIYRHIAHRPNLIKIAENVGWLFFDKILRMGVGLIVGVWIARYLGPEQFGLLNFASALTSLFAAFVVLGLPGIVVRDIVHSPGEAPLILGSAAFLHLIGGLASILLITGAITYLRPEDLVARKVVFILSSAMLLKSSEIAVYWFESQVQSKYIVWVQNSVFLVFVSIKVVFILQNAPLLQFVWIMLIEAICVAILMLFIMNIYGPALTSLRISLSRMTSLLKDSWPLILSAIAISLYMKIDQLMLGQMLGDEAVGIYSAAVKISEVWYFIPMAIMSSVFPAILEAKKYSEVQYYAHLQKLYDFMAIISVTIALPMTFLATPIVTLLYGVAYIESGIVLSIHIWASVFVFLGVASSTWFISENRQILFLQRTVLGAVVNIGLNFWAIPHYGVTGAAIATVFSQAVSAFLSDYLQQETRSMFAMKFASLNPISLFKRLV